MKSENDSVPGPLTGRTGDVSNEPRTRGGL
jgi:hypothetical protein